jgi:mannose-6-phosphate isomerase-like protein (cupin superfamily)
MSDPTPGPAVVVRADDVETLANRSVGLHLLADSSATGHALSSLRVELHGGADGAVPHRHDRSSELFYVLDGTAQLLAGQDVITAVRGELIVVPPGAAPYVRRPRGRRCRAADHHHAGRRALRVLPPAGPDRVRAAAAREPARGAGALRHVLPRQPVVAHRTGLIRLSRKRAP